MRISDWSSDVCSSDLLRGAEHMARRHEAHADIADPDLFAIADGLRMSRLARTRAHDGERLRRGEHMAVAAERMVRWARSDERSGGKGCGCDVGVACQFKTIRID